MPVKHSNKQRNSKASNDEFILIENKTIQKVSTIISSLELAINSWKTAGKKPGNIRKLMIDFQDFKNELQRWQKQTLLRTNHGTDAKLENLTKFTTICSKYSVRFRLQRRGRL